MVDNREGGKLLTKGKDWDITKKYNCKTSYRIVGSFVHMQLPSHRGLFIIIGFYPRVFLFIVQVWLIFYMKFYCI